MNLALDAYFEFNGTGLPDNICPPSTQFAAKKSVLLYPDNAHERDPDWDDAMMQFMLTM